MLAARLGAVAVLLVMAVGFVGTGQEPAEARIAATTPRLRGIEVVYSSTRLGSGSPQKVSAKCTPGKQVLGGGAAVYGHPRRHVTLTRLQPYRPGGQDPENPLGYGYLATAAETEPGTTDEWGLEAMAICADPVDGLHIVSHYTDWSLSSVQATDAVCPSGERVLGTGARIIPINVGAPEFEHGIGLQVARVDALGGLTRAQAQTQPNGYVYGRWRLAAYAVCSPTPFGYEVMTATSDLDDSESHKTAEGDCPTYEYSPYIGQTRYFHRRPVGVGGAVTNSAPANVTLNGVYPFGSEWRSAVAEAWENTPTDVDWSAMIVRYVCVVG